MPTRSGNPGALAGAAGAEKKKQRRDDAAIGGDAQEARRTKSEKAAFCFAFLDRLKRDPQMKSLDALAALWFIQFVGDDLTFYMSARHLTDLMRRKAESVGEDCLWRFRRGGYLVHITDAPSKVQNGRPANVYRLAIPDAVSPEKSGETAKPKKTVSPEKTGEVSPGKSGTITCDNTLEGGRALGRASANSTNVCSVIDEEEHLDAVQKRAHEPLEAAQGASAADPVSASEIPEPASDIDPPETRPFVLLADDADLIPVLTEPDTEDRDNDAEPATLADLIAASDEEEEAVMMRAAFGAADALWRLHDDDIGDVDSYAADFVAGATGDGEAAGRAAQVAAKQLIEMMDAGKRGAARDVWNDHAVILTSALSGFMPRAHAQAAVKKFNDAVGVAGRDLAARRNAAQKREGQVEAESNG